MEEQVIFTRSSKMGLRGLIVMEMLSRLTLPKDTKQTPSRTLYNRLFFTFKFPSLFRTQYMTYAIQCGLKVRISTSTLLEYLNKRVGKYLFRHFLLFSEAYFVHFLLQLTATLYFMLLF